MYDPFVDYLDNVLTVYLKANDTCNDLPLKKQATALAELKVAFLNLFCSEPRNYWVFTLFLYTQAFFYFCIIDNVSWIVVSTILSVTDEICSTFGFEDVDIECDH